MRCRAVRDGSGEVHLGVQRGEQAVNCRVQDRLACLTAAEEGASGAVAVRTGTGTSVSYTMLCGGKTSMAETACKYEHVGVRCHVRLEEDMEHTSHAVSHCVQAYGKVALGSGRGISGSFGVPAHAQRGSPACHPSAVHCQERVTRRRAQRGQVTGIACTLRSLSIERCLSSAVGGGSQQRRPALSAGL
ncbi:hypothetical protein BC834DRAFT_340894 [Gloeopeniophorella convolvens]|nr:hypothetical protein BC834DRAFT_340894 [Gloeopeniophorella convolvens]